MGDSERSGTTGDRASRLSAAILKVTRSLELATVLEEAVRSARALTGARHAVVTTVDARGRVCDFITSGHSPAERQAMLEWPDGPRLFEHLRDLPGPLCVADFPGYLRSLGSRGAGRATTWCSRCRTRGGASPRSGSRTSFAGGTAPAS